MRKRYGGYYGRKRSGGYNGGIGSGSMKAAVLTLLFWAVSALVMIGFLHGGLVDFAEAKSEDVARMYIGSVFPTVSRSSDYQAREAMGSDLEPAGEEAEGLLDEKQSETIFQSLMGSMFPAAEVLDDDLAEEDPGIIFDTGTDDSGTEGSDDSGKETGNADDGDTSQTSTADIDYSKPVVIIYHTHATESYQPVTDGNFHSLNEYGTVREVGDVLAKELEAKGIQVIHDKTIHDSPSYNQSYTRSLETVKRLMGNSEGKQIVIDLHRDAAGYSGNTAKTTAIGKQTVAKYSLVVGNGNPNAAVLKQFAGQVNQAAEAMYPGFGGRIIEKQYKFNQYVSDHHILLEVGNNENTIEQAKLTGKYFADVLADVIKDIE